MLDTQQPRHSRFSSRCGSPWRGRCHPPPPKYFFLILRHSVPQMIKHTRQTHWKPKTCVAECVEAARVFTGPLPGAHFGTLAFIGETGTRWRRRFVYFPRGVNMGVRKATSTAQHEYKTLYRSSPNKGVGMDIRRSKVGPYMDGCCGRMKKTSSNMSSEIAFRWPSGNATKIVWVWSFSTPTYCVHQGRIQRCAPHFVPSCQFCPAVALRFRPPPEGFARLTHIMDPLRSAPPPEPARRQVSLLKIAQNCSCHDSLLC